MGENCKYSGGNNYCSAIEALQAYYELIPVCPERDGGLPIPRPPAERQGCHVVNREGMDVTAQYMRGAEIALDTAQLRGCTKALLKERSPSCGCGMIYDGTFTGTLVSGDGITAAKLKDAGITVYGENAISDLLK